MLDRVARTEVLEVGVVVRQVREARVVGARVVRRYEGLDCDRLGLDLAYVDRGYSLIEDCRLLARIVVAVVKGAGAR